MIIFNVKGTKIILKHFFFHPISMFMDLRQLKHLRILLQFLFHVSFGVCSSLFLAIGSPN